MEDEQLHFVEPREAVIYLALHIAILPVIHSDECGAGVLTVENVVVTVAERDLEGVQQAVIEVFDDLLDLSVIQVSLIQGINKDIPRVELLVLIVAFHIHLRVPFICSFSY